MKKSMFVGVDLGGTHMRTALVDSQGRILQQSRVETEIKAGAAELTRRLTGECRLHMQRAAELGSEVAAVGLGVAGKIDRGKGRVVFSPNLPPLRDYPLSRELQKDLNIPVIMENDANVFGIGEGWVGAGRGIDNWIGMTLGTGVGGCLIFAGRLWEGDNLGFVGEIGHMVVCPGGPKCPCGLRGCLEAHASGTALLTGVSDAVQSRVLTTGPLYESWRDGSLDPESVHRYAMEGDSTALRLFRRMGWALGLAIANLFTVLGIRHAVIGGGVSAGWDQFIGPLTESLAEHSSMLAPEEMIIKRATLGDDAGLLGAARLAREYGKGQEG